MNIIHLPLEHFQEPVDSTGHPHTQEPDGILRICLCSENGIELSRNLEQPGFRKEHGESKQITFTR